MGTDWYSNVIVGFPAYFEDFWIETETGNFVCENGHQRQNPDWTVCPICGDSFGEEVEKEPTERFAAFADAKQLDPEKLYETWMGAEGHEVGFYDASQHSHTMSEDGRNPVLGVTLLGTESSRRSGEGEETVSVTEDELKSVLDAIRELRDQLGFSDREIRIYGALYCSY